MILALLITPLIATFLSATLGRTRERAIEYCTVAAGVIEAGIAILIAYTTLTSSVVYAPPLFAVDALGAFALLFTTIVGLAAAMHSIGYLRQEREKDIIGFRRVREYYVLFHLFFFAMFVAATTGSPIVMWTAIEATTLATAFLISFYNKPSALEAGWKHLIVNSVGLLLGFLGTLLFLNAAASVGEVGTFISWDALRTLSPALDPMLIKIAFIFCLVGYGTKVGFVPMHTWLPDAHSKAPAPISSLLSGVLLNMALIAVIRFRAITDMVIDPSFSQYLLIGFGLVSLIVAALIIFGQKNYKRMLAYSSIEHMGLMAIGFAIGGVAAVAALFHMLYHALLKPILFFAAGNFFLKYSSTKTLKIRGALTLMPFTAVAFFAALLAVSGIPPSGIFFTKLTMLSAGIDAFPYSMLLVMVALALILAGFLKSATLMLFSEAPADLPKGEANAWTVAAIAFLALLFVVFSIYVPAPLRELITNAAAIIQ